MITISALLSAMTGEYCQDKTAPRLTSLRSKKRLLVSYDNQAIAKQKAQYINQLGLGGAMWWELDADKPEETGGALISTVREQFGQLEYRENELSYPGSSGLSHIGGRKTDGNFRVRQLEEGYVARQERLKA